MYLRKEYYRHREKIDTMMPGIFKKEQVTNVTRIG